MERTRRELAGAAKRLFVERGYDATTVDDIAAEVEVSARTFFRYFRNKEDLVTALCRTGLEDIVERLEDRPDDEPLFEAVNASVRDACAVHDPVETRAFIRVMTDTPALRARWLDESRHNQHQLARVLAPRMGLDAGDMKVQITAGAVLLAAQTAFNTWGSLTTDESLDDYLSQALATLLEPLLPA